MEGVVLFCSLQKKYDSCTFSHYQLLLNIPCPLVKLQYSRSHLKGSYMRMSMLRTVRNEVRRRGASNGICSYEISCKSVNWFKAVMGKHRQEEFPV